MEDGEIEQVCVELIKLMGNHKPDEPEAAVPARLMKGPCVLYRDEDGKLATLELTDPKVVETIEQSKEKIKNSNLDEKEKEELLSMAEKALNEIADRTGQDNKPKVVFMGDSVLNFEKKPSEESKDVQAEKADETQEAKEGDEPNIQNPEVREALRQFKEAERKGLVC